MSYTLIKKFLSSQDLSAVRALHLVAKGIFRATGFRWEIRRHGELKLGYWRKTLKPRSRKTPYPKRFVLIPGFGDTPLSWHLVTVMMQPVLKNYYDEIILIDFPGFGGFLSHERSFPSMDFMMSMLNDTLDSLKPHTIFGHSLGGWLTAHYAAECGSGVRPYSNKLNYSGPEAILLSNPSGIFTDAKTRQEWEAIFRTAMIEGFPALRPHLFKKEPAWFSLIVPHFSQFILREDVHQFMSSFREDHAADRFASQIRAKTWLIWGEHDTLIPASCAQAWQDHLDKNVQFEEQIVMIKGVGHSPHLEAPAATAAVIAQIVSGRIPHRIGKRWWKVIGSGTALDRPVA